MTAEQWIFFSRMYTLGGSPREKENLEFFFLRFLKQLFNIFSPFYSFKRPLCDNNVLLSDAWRTGGTVGYSMF